ncbi:MAG: DMT family transporter [Candidatus Anammoxibacter sp.]
MNWILIIIAVAAGALLPIQGSLNARLGSSMPHPMQATLVSYIGGLLACLIFLTLMRINYPDLKKIFSIDWHLYCGGFLGAAFVSAMLYLMPRIGVTNMLAAAIVGQLIMSIIIDHFGCFGVFTARLNLSRIVGVIMLLGGLYFIQRR